LQIAGSSFGLLLRGFQNRVHAIGKILQRLSRAASRSLIAFETTIDALKYRIERNTGLLPRLHDRPIERGYQQMRAALLPEVFFDFGKIVEVIPVLHVRDSSLRQRSVPIGAPSSPVRLRHRVSSLPRRHFGRARPSNSSPKSA